MQYEYIYVPHKDVKSPVELAEVLNTAGKEGFKLMPELIHHQNCYWFLHEVNTPADTTLSDTAKTIVKKAKANKTQPRIEGTETTEAKTDEV